MNCVTQLRPTGVIEWMIVYGFTTEKILYEKDRTQVQGHLSIARSLYSPSASLIFVLGPGRRVRSRGLVWGVNMFAGLLSMVRFRS